MLEKKKLKIKIKIKQERLSCNRSLYNNSTVLECIHEALARLIALVVYFFACRMEVLESDTDEKEG